MPRRRLNTEIATRLFVTEATVNTHTFAQTRDRDCARVVRYAFHQGLAAMNHSRVWR